MATITASTLVVGEAKTDPVATVTRVWKYYQTATCSSGDVFFHPKWLIPNHATITSVRVSGATTDGTAIVVPNIRIYNSASAATDIAFGSLTLSPAGRIADVVYSSAGDSARLPYTHSASDDAANHNAHFIVKCQANASATTSTSMCFIVTYVTNGDWV